MFICLGAFATPNEKVLTSFSSSFPKAEAITWFESETDYEVNFNMGEVKCKIWYDKEGSILKCHRYYKQNMLPPMIISSIQTKYAGKDIYGITEVTSGEGIQYYIVLQDDKKWYNVTSDASGTLTLTKKFNKA